jgi:hypothetical protein
MNGFSTTTADGLPCRGAAARPQALERVAQPPHGPASATDPTLTMRVYLQVLDMGRAAVERLEGVLDCTIQEAFETYSGREVWSPNGHPARKSLAGPRPAAARPKAPPRHRLRLCRA